MKNLNKKNKEPIGTVKYRTCKAGQALAATSVFNSQPLLCSLLVLG
jgi:hypothetical protein